MPHSLLEQVVVACFMLIGLLLYGYALAYLAATLANLDVARVKFSTRIDAIKDFMDDRGLANDLKLSVSVSINSVHCCDHKA